MPHATPNPIPILLSLTLAAAPLPARAESPFLRTAATTDAAVLELGPRTISVAPGSNALLELAIDHLNRIVTPFQRPSVRTVASLTTEIDGNVLYVATASEEPATLYITDADDARTTVGLTIAPRRVPPREIRLRVPGLRPAAAKTPEQDSASASAPVAAAPQLAGSWQQPQAYVAELTATLRALARGEVPAGYNQRRAGASETPTCAPPGLSVQRGQVLDGGPLTFVTATLNHSGKSPVAINETTCRLGADHPVVAVAAWPRTRLAPGNTTALYLAVRSAPATGKD